MKVASARVDELTEDQRRAVARQTTLRARIDALALGLDRRDGAGALLAARDPGTRPAESDGILGSVSAVADVRPGAEAAIAAALGAAADAVAVRDVQAAAAALATLRDRGAGRAGLLVGTGTAQTAGRPTALGDQEPPLPPGAVPALDLISVPERAPSGDRGAARLDRRRGHPRGRIRPGRDASSADRGDPGRGPARLAVGRRRQRRRAVGTRDPGRGGRGGGGVGRGHRRAGGHRCRAGRCPGRARRNAPPRRTTALSALYESDARLAAVAEQLGRLGEAARSAAAESDRLAERRQAAEAAQHRFRDEVAELETRLAAAESDPVPADADPDPPGRAGERDGGRAAERRSRPGSRCAPSRSVPGRRPVRPRTCAAPPGRSGRRGNGPGSPPSAAPPAPRSPPGWWTSAVACPTRLADAVVRGGPRADERRIRPGGRRAHRRRGAHRRGRIAGGMGRPDHLGALHRGAAGAADVRLEQLEESATVEFGIGVEDLLAEFGPDVPVPPSAAEMGEYQAARDRGEAVVAPGSDGLRPGRHAATGQARRTRPRPARQGEPTGAGGVRGHGGTACVPVRSARGPALHPPRPAQRGEGGRRADPRAVLRRLLRRGTGVRRRSSRRCSPAARANWCSPIRRTCSAPASR